MKLIFVLIIALFLSGCSNSAEIGKTETVPVNEFHAEGTARIEKGKVYTYSYSYENEDGNKGEGKVHILKLNKELSLNKMLEFADEFALANEGYIVVDLRILNDPNMHIRNSYRGKLEQERQCVIDILLDYEKKYPSSWERSEKSMKNEWFWHNSAYEAGYSKSRAMHVDFNNEDEEEYPKLLPFAANHFDE